MARLERYEREFRRAGLPLLIEGYSPAEDIFNRAVPLLGLVFFAETLAVLNRDWPTRVNLVAVLGGLAILIAALMALNRIRGRPLRSLPRRVGRVELAGFVLVPALLPGLISGHWGVALSIAVGNLVLLGAILAVVGFGLLSIVGWTVSRLLGQLSSSLGLLVKAVPLLMIFSLILFLTPELWEVFAGLDDLRLGLLVGLFVLLGVGFLAMRLPVEVRALERDAASGGPPLRGLQRFNIGLVLFVSQSIQILLVSCGVGAFFVVFGLLTIDPEILRSWVGTGGETLVRFRLGDSDAVITVELIRVAGALAAFTGLYFTISSVTDALYRREFLEQITGEMRIVFAHRAKYLALRARGGETDV